jgi:hypothetical protein
MTKRALAASALLLCAIACAAIALLTIASSATEELAQQPHFTSLSRSSASGLEAQLEADAKSAAAKDAGAQLLQSQLIKYELVVLQQAVDSLSSFVFVRYAQAAAHPKSEADVVEQNQLKRANAVQESLSKIAQDHPASNAPDLAGSLVAHVKADDAKVLLCSHSSRTVVFSNSSPSPPPHPPRVLRCKAP